MGKNAGHSGASQEIATLTRPAPDLQTPRTLPFGVFATTATLNSSVAIVGDEKHFDASQQSCVRARIEIYGTDSCISVSTGNFRRSMIFLFLDLEKHIRCIPRCCSEGCGSFMALHLQQADNPRIRRQKREKAAAGQDCSGKRTPTSRLTQPL